MAFGCKTNGKGMGAGKLAKIFRDPRSQNARGHAFGRDRRTPVKPLLEAIFKLSRA